MLKNVSDYFYGAEFDGFIEKTVDFVTAEQLTRVELWEKFIEVFRSGADGADNGWRGEFWGKTMRGGCLVYSYSRNPKLYRVLKSAVSGLIACQEENGRLSSYPQDGEFRGWDLWCRKYVLTGLFHFYDICDDEFFKKKVLSAAENHLDYIVKRIGEGDGKISVFRTSNAWKGLNSCTLLEPVVEAYKKTGKKDYLDFAEYLLSCGGCEDGNLIDIAFKNEIPPYRYPVLKAYEMISYFEGVLSYAELTGDRYYFDAVIKFADALVRSEVSVIGCLGCDCECLNNSVEKQTENIIPYHMQETCVTVTWMRLCARLFRDTGNFEYMNLIECSALNAFYGSVNFELRSQYCVEKSAVLPGLPFDSYAPLSDDSRGRGIGGFKQLGADNHYGCCAAIGAAGVALVPLCAVMNYNGGLLFNGFFDGKIKASVSGEKTLTLSVNGDYPVSDGCTVTVAADGAVNYALFFRVPKWCDNFSVCVNGEIYKPENGLVRAEREWRDGDVIRISAPKKLCRFVLNGKEAYSYGPFTLAYSEEKQRTAVDDVGFTETDYGFAYKTAVPDRDERLCVIVKRSDGKILRLCDYSSCGKNYSEKISVWIKRA